MLDTILTTGTLPVGTAGHKSGGWWGVLALIVTEGFLFGYLLFTYFYLASQAEQHWPPSGMPVLFMPGVNTIILLTSSVFVWLCEYCLRRAKKRFSLLTMTIAIILGSCFVYIQLLEWGKKSYGMTSNLYGSLYFTITGFHMLHVIVGLFILLLLLIWIAFGYFDSKRNVAVSIGGLYWHFVDVVWLLVFTSLYLTPFLI